MYDGATQAAIPITVALGAAQLLFAWNIGATLRGKGVERALRSTKRPRRRVSHTAAEALIVLLALSLAIPAGVVGWVIGHYAGTPQTRTVTVSAVRPTTPTTSATPTSTPPTTTAAGSGGGNPAAGKPVFASAGCSGCHTLRAAGATGTVGPNLDQARPSLALAIDRVTHGKGAMPAFAGQLSEQQIKDVAAFVVASR